MFEKYVSVPIIPVAVVETEDEIRAIADLCMEFLPALELTMRTEYSYRALELLSKDYPNLPVAAATILSVEQADIVLKIGADILISPGFQPTLLEHAKNKKYNYIPGAVTASEIEQCMAYGHRYIKFFPASVFGGVSWIKAMAPVYSHMGVKFMPLGGINLDNVKDFLAEKTVFACGGSWLCPRDILIKKDWNGLRKKFLEASSIIENFKK